MNDNEKIKTLQAYEYKLQQFLMQKQQIDANILEINNALKELNSKKEAYEIVGNIMVKKTSADLVKSLNEKKSFLDIKLKATIKQENATKEKADALQKEVVEAMSKNGKQ